jgi:hypothetical protein
VIDIETAPCPKSVAKNTKPFSKADVKLGAMVDPVKIAAKLAAAEEKHWSDAYGKAALDPSTGVMVALGVQLEDSKPELLYGTEKEILEAFWVIYSNHVHYTRFAFYTGNSARSAFDVRFILVRSWVNKVKVPIGVLKDGGYIAGSFVDLANIFLAGADYPAYCGLDRAASILNLHGEDVGFMKVMSKSDLKDAGVDGKYFYQVLDENKKLADTYLLNDLALTRALANRIL